MLLSGMVLISGSFVSCDNGPAEDENKTNTLEVAPSKSISFEASGNDDVVLAVTTDASSWDFKKPEWVEATKSEDGKTLVVNAKNKTTEGSRTGRLEISAGTAKSVFITVSQKEPSEVPDNTLSVDPSEKISFKAAGNTDVVLTVTTDADDWNFNKPEWMTATKDGSTLTVNAQDNTDEYSRVGRLTISAGTAKNVVINVSQNKVGSSGETNPDAVAGSLKDKSGVSEKNFEIADADPIQANVNFLLAENAKEAVSAEIFVDAAYLKEYNFMNKTNYVLYPESLLTIAADGAATIAAGAKSSDDVLVTIETDSELIEYNVSYMVPLCVRTSSPDVTIDYEDSYVTYILKRKNKKEIKNVLYFEVNETNPLNALEYVLEDGQMFFDAVILFAANIKYDSGKNKIYLHNNPNVQMLLDETDVYLQPLRKKGIKVWLGILGDWDPAGLAQLSETGADMFAEELANAVKEYKLDGVNFDDEYSSSPITSNPLFVSRSSSAAARLCYKTKKKMEEVCGEEKDMTVYYLGQIHSGMPSYNGFEPGTFIDQASADYNQSTYPMSGMTLKQCAGMSIQLNQGGSLSQSTANSIKSNGYGWVMWFAFDPNPTGGLKNGSHSIPVLKNAAQYLYGQPLKEPKYYYKKVKDVSIDPTPYPFN